MTEWLDCMLMISLAQANTSMPSKTFRMTLQVSVLVFSIACIICPHGSGLEVGTLETRCASVVPR